MLRKSGTHPCATCSIVRVPTTGRACCSKSSLFISAAIPLILFLRAMFGGRKTKIGAAFGEFKKQIDVAIYIFLGLDRLPRRVRARQDRLDLVDAAV